MRGPDELVDLRQPFEPVPAAYQRRGVAREGGGVAGDGYPRVKPGAGESGGLIGGARARRIEHHRSAAVGASQTRLGRLARFQKIACRPAQSGDRSEQRRLRYRAFLDIDERVAEPAAEPDPDFLSAIAGPVEAEPRSPARRCDDLQRGNRARLDAPPVEARAQVVKLGPPISLRVEMLQCGRAGPPWTRRDQIDEMPLVAAAAPRRGERATDRPAQ
jgi:hypothetical protein